MPAKTPGKSSKKSARKKAKKKVAKKKSAKKAAKKVAKNVAKRPAKKAAKRTKKARQEKQAVSAEARHQMIEIAAYFFAESRHFQDGDPVADWLHCEKEIDAQIGT